MANLKKSEEMLELARAATDNMTLEELKQAVWEYYGGVGTYANRQH